MDEVKNIKKECFDNPVQKLWVATRHL